MQYMVFFNVINNFFNIIPKKSRLTKWLLFGILSVSVFSFSGFVANNYSGYSQGVRTEFVVTPTSSIKRVISFNRVVTELFHRQQHSGQAGYLFNVCLYHNRLISIRLRELSQAITYFKPFTPLLPVKTIPERSNQDPLHITTC